MTILLIVIAGATWARLQRPDLGYAVAIFLSRHYHGGEVHHRFTETFLVSLSLAILSTYVGFIACRDIRRSSGRKKEASYNRSITHDKSE
ncbi:MAG TPA: hypothetical protein VM821_06815 [Abditibacteriaceae bacterium]|nr:hypothetical protein [Abditibacteriaceae bacterium]